MDYNDIIGQRFNNLTIDRFAFKEKRNKRCRYFYDCLCDCGNTVRVDRSNLLELHTKSCGCLKKRRGKHSKSWTGHEGISGYFWNKIKRHTKRSRMIPFEITIEYAWDLFEKQGRKCALTGLPIEMASGSKNGTWRGSASLDRINSSIGYLEGNVQWVHKDLNAMKWNLSQERFIELCKLVVQHGNS